MEIFYIPFKPDATHGWKVPIPKDGERQFGSRNDALAFARRIAKQTVTEQSEVAIYACKAEIRSGGYSRPTSSLWIESFGRRFFSHVYAVPSHGGGSSPIRYPVPCGLAIHPISKVR
ncbi:hypothetical protein HDE78_000083 [Rhodanobacter sp. K2T2]|uniref:hypothetical protein n=1 Tax=Rhodanobacter sp. K2T2 TaxID=2723085 RepID=UPI0015CEA217|nr:hypothetical protein [Rhodanobacter sp. K2T2]NYE27158.1 hypothetical protein [Rhodanobacter sp. K2T2]